MTRNEISAVQCLLSTGNFRCLKSNMFYSAMYFNHSFFHSMYMKFSSVYNRVRPLRAKDIHERHQWNCVSWFVVFAQVVWNPLRNRSIFLPKKVLHQVDSSVRHRKTFVSFAMKDLLFPTPKTIYFFKLLLCLYLFVLRKQLGWFCFHPNRNISTAF